MGGSEPIFLLTEWQDKVRKYRELHWTEEGKCWTELSGVDLSISFRGFVTFTIPAELSRLRCDGY